MKSVDGNEHIELRTGKLPLGVDSKTKVLTTIDYSHHEIHDGNHFLYTDAQELASGATGDYLITVKNSTKWPHMLFDLSGSAITQYLLYEATDRVGVTLETVGNSNRNSANATPETTIHKGVTGGSTNGTLIHEFKGGSATNQSKSGSNTRNDEEIILKQNTKYLLKVGSFTASNLTNVRIAFYEHANKA